MRYDKDYYCKENFFPKFEALLDARYCHEREAHRRKHFCEEYDKKYAQKNEEGDYTSIYSSLRQWTWNRTPSIEKLMNICELLDCDIDYFLTEQKEFKKEIASAADVTGLQYETIETLQEIKNSKKRDTNKFIDKGILFILDFLLQRKNGRWILWNMFQYLFKKYRGVKEHEGTGANTIILDDGSGIPQRDTALFVHQISDSIFYSNITEGIAAIKKEEHTQEMDISEYEYTPTLFEINQEIRKLQDRKKDFSAQDYDAINPFTPEYALSYVYHDATNEWKDFSCLASRVRDRAVLDNYSNETIEDFQSQIEEMELIRDRIKNIK